MIHQLTCTTGNWYGIQNYEVCLIFITTFGMGSERYTVRSGSKVMGENKARSSKRLLAGSINHSNGDAPPPSRLTPIMVLWLICSSVLSPQKRMHYTNRYIGTINATTKYNTSIVPYTCDSLLQHLMFRENPDITPPCGGAQRSFPRDILPRKYATEDISSNRTANTNTPSQKQSWSNLKKLTWVGTRERHLPFIPSED